MFVKIETLNDILPYIDETAGIKVMPRDGFTVVDYLFTTDETFTSPQALECRGLKFAPDGRILARPFHKFFNIGEREQVEQIDWAAPHLVLDKLDGTMIHPCMVHGRMVLMTRMGATSHGAAAQAQASSGMLALCARALAEGVTPIFEWTSPDNRVVMPYETSQMTLLAARHTVSGSYLPPVALADMAASNGVPVVQAHSPVANAKAFVAGARALERAEGYVIAFDSGHRIKVKADAYVLRHKALSGVAHEKNLLAWIVQGALDDVLAILPPPIAARVQAYNNRLMRRLSEIGAEVTAFHREHSGLPRGDYARLVQQDIDPRLKPVAFAVLDGRDAHGALMKLLAWASHSDPRVDQVRDIFDLDWTDPVTLMEEA